MFEIGKMEKIAYQDISKEYPCHFRRNSVSSSIHGVKEVESTKEEDKETKSHGDCRNSGITRHRKYYNSSHYQNTERETQ